MLDEFTILLNTEISLIQKSHSSLFQRCQCFRRGFYRKTTVLGYLSSSCLIRFSHSDKRVVQNEKKISGYNVSKSCDDVSILERQSVPNCSFMSTLIDDSDDFGKSYKTKLIKNFAKRSDVFVKTYELLLQTWYCISTSLCIMKYAINESSVFIVLFARTLQTHVFSRMFPLPPESFQITE